MPDQEKVTVLRQQLHTAEQACAAWHAAGNQERYMESYVLTEAIELQLLHLLEAGRRDAAGPVRQSAVSPRLAPGSSADWPNELSPPLAGPLATRVHDNSPNPRWRSSGERVDSITQSIVDQGIVMFDQGSTREALQYFRHHQMPDELVSRVVRNPDERRRYINDFVTGN
ncbi:hypothetical protein [Chitinimonas sp. BJYL2]|uniref:hypothetical protein n=1 Tax=Chitinimonas sp. BJYL2 TaxID=2976696 RepID=UPI0022B527E8|nr:hypothetical protein [Chitinimonas sp. BJYL2]